MIRKRIVTMDEIARLAKVSKPTVSRALSDSPLVNPKTKQHVLAVAKTHGYAVNRNAQKLRHKRTNTIAVSLDFRSHRESHIADPFVFDLLAGVSEALGDKNQDLLLCAPIHNDTDAFQDILSSRAADGFIVLGQGHREDMLHELSESGAPFIVWGARNDETPYCTVGSDNFLGGELAGRYFLENKRRHFLFVGDTTFREIALRRDGLTKVAEESPETVVVSDLTLSDFSYEAAADALSTFFDEAAELPDAVFAFNDTAAMAVIAACRERGLSVPKSVSVVGYNDIPSAAYFSPPITTIRQGTIQAGRLLAANLMMILDGEKPRSSTIKTELIVRAT
jgi:DNA-binding LacI/PurR family transcriptional regulator